MPFGIHPKRLASGDGLRHRMRSAGLERGPEIWKAERHPIAPSTSLPGKRHGRGVGGIGSVSQVTVLPEELTKTRSVKGLAEGDLKTC